MKWVQDSVQPIPCPATLRSRQRSSSSALSEVSLWACRGGPCRVANHRQNFLPILQNCGPLLRVRVRERGERASADVPRLLLRNGLELDHLRSGKCDAQHLGSEVHEHSRIAVLGADHSTEAVPIMADSITDRVARHNCDGSRLVEGTSWEGPRVAGAGRSHASSVRPVGRAGAPLPEVAGRTSGVHRVCCGLQSGSSHPINTDGEISGSPARVRHGRPNGGNVGFDPNGPIFCYFSNIAAASGCCQKNQVTSSDSPVVRVEVITVGSITDWLGLPVRDETVRRSVPGGCPLRYVD